MTKKEFIREQMREKKSKPSASTNAVLSLEAYENEHYFEPHLSWPKREFERRSIERWVTEEIINLIRMNPDTEPDILAEEFLFDLLKCMNETDNADRENQFRIATNVAENIIDYFHSLKGE